MKKKMKKKGKNEKMNFRFFKEKGKEFPIESN